MKTARNLSGIWFRYQDPETKEWGNRCFEDLPEEKQDEYMKDRELDWHKRMIKILSNVINDIGDHFDIIKG